MGGVIIGSSKLNFNFITIKNNVLTNIYNLDILAINGIQGTSIWPRATKSCLWADRGES